MISSGPAPDLRGAADALLSDVVLALRGLRRRPGFALAAILTLAVGIGANTAVYSIVQAVLQRPLPFRDPERLVLVWEWNKLRDRMRNVVNPGNYLEWRDRNTVFEQVAAFAPSAMNLSGEIEPERLRVGVVTANLFSTLGVAPSLGRGFLAEEAKAGSADVVVLGDGLWRRRFGGDPGVIGREILLDGRPHRVVGVMPSSFQVPPGSELWVRLTEEGPILRRGRGGRFLVAVARLEAGVTVAQARANLEGIAAQLVAERPDFNTGWSVFVAPLHADLVREVRPAMLVLFGAVLVLLLVACGNVANLLLVRGLARSREIAVRRALGAGAGRIAKQLLTESLVLAGAGGALGLLLAAWFKEALLAVVPAEIRTLFAFRLDPGALAFALGLCVLSTLVFGLAPIIHATGPERFQALHEGSAGAGASRKRRRFANAVVAAEVALSIVLLVGASLLLRSFRRLAEEPKGFDPRGVLSLDLSLSGPRYADEGAVARFYEQLIPRIAALPGVAAAGGMSWRPLSVGMATRFEVPDRPAPIPGHEPVADVRIVTPGLFRTLGIRLVAGRDFDERDTAGRPTVVVVNEALAREFWPGDSPLGRRIRMQMAGRTLDAEIVGTVADVRLVGLEMAPRSQLYWPFAQAPVTALSVLARTAGDPAQLAQPAKQAVASLDPGLPVADVMPLERVVGDALQQRRFTFGLLGSFALVAALLAGLGLFGVLSYSVRERRREWGIRLALGATRADVAGLVLRDGAHLVLLGGAAGLVAALALSGLLSRLLYQVSPRDPAAFLGVAVGVAFLALAAIALPAAQAARVAPAAALREE